MLGGCDARKENMGLLDFFKNKSLKGASVSQQKKVVGGKKIVEENRVFSAEQYMKTAIPSQNGLYPQEILMLDYAESYKTTGNTFQNFWKYNYYVTDPQKILDSLYNRGFIKYSDVQSTLRKLLVSDLKGLLEKIGEKTSGKKEELINRILEKYTLSDLEEVLPGRNYELTEKGENELKQNEYVPYLHKHKYVSVWDMNIMLNANNPSHLGYRDIIWRELNKQSEEYFQEFDFGLYRCARLSMHDFLYEEKKYKTAFHLLVEVISFDLSGLGNGDKPIKGDAISRQIKCESRIANLFTNDEIEVTLPPAIIGYFNRLYEKLGMSANEFIKHTYQEFAKIHIHERIFNENECANIILSEIGLEERKIKNSYKVAVQRTKKKFGLK